LNSFDVYFAAFLSSALNFNKDESPENPSRPAIPNRPSCGMRASFATEATFSTNDDNSKFVMPDDCVPSRVNAISFSKERTLIFSWPCSILLIVSSK